VRTRTEEITISDHLGLLAAAAWIFVKRRQEIELTRARLKTSLYESMQYLKTKKDIVSYLDAALEDGDHAVIRHAFNVVAQSRGIAPLERNLGSRRRDMSSALEASGKLKLTTALKILHSLGLRLQTKHPNL